MSSVQLYNVQGVIRKNDIEDITKFGEFLQALAIQTDGVKVDRKLLQSLVFLLRDFQETDVDNEVFGFEAALKQAKRNQAGFDKLSPFFESVNFYAMPEPHKFVKHKVKYDNKLKVSGMKQNNF